MREGEEREVIRGERGVGESSNTISSGLWGPVDSVAVFRVLLFLCCLSENLYCGPRLTLCRHVEVWCVSRWGEEY